jgi:hypothetical protein
MEGRLSSGKPSVVREEKTSGMMRLAVHARRVATPTVRSA